MELILASGSPRRKELLALVTPEFSVAASDVDESAISAPTPVLLVQKLAHAKCHAVAVQHPSACVLGCDTVVDVDGEVLGKPRDAADARRMMRLLSGRTHRVHTGVCLAVPGRPILYRTTKTFLRSFGLSSLEELPELPSGTQEGDQMTLKLEAAVARLKEEENQPPEEGEAP